MLICNKCLKENFDNNEYFLKSYGKCDICNENYLCNDIPRGILMNKKKEYNNESNRET